MKVTTVTCDRCRRPVERGGSVLRAAGAIRDAIGDPDLCEPCGRALVAWLREGVTAAAADGREGGGGLCLDREPFHP